MYAEPVEQQISVHGRCISYRSCGAGPLVILIHGIAGRSEQWNDVMPLLANNFTVLAPDLLGHGRSAKPRGDYSLGAFASGIRDLMLALGHSRATIVGHSLGGGIAMQFLYQFPELVERLVLVSSGGLGREVHPLLRAATLPGSEFVLPLIANDHVQGAGAAVNKLLSKVGLRAGADVAEMARCFASLRDNGARQAFVHTMRAVVEPGGQRVNASDRFYLSEAVPTLLLWGRRDGLIPAVHGEQTHLAMPSSRLEIFEDSGHFPMLDQPRRFAQALREFIEQTKPAKIDVKSLGQLLVDRAGEPIEAPSTKA